MASVVLGWILVGVGVLSYLVALAVLVKERFFAPAQRDLLPNFTEADLKVIAELVDKLAKAMEQFGKLSVPVQWAILGLLQIGVGAYLISARPF